MTQIRVATFNIRNGRAFDGRNSWPFRRRTTAESIRDLNADFVGVQEAFGFQSRYLRRQLTDFRTYGEARSGHSWGERCLTLVRQTWPVVRAHTHWFGGVRGEALAGAQFPRVATIVTLRLDDAGLVQFVNTHLDERDATNRERSASELVKQLDLRWPTVVVGDLNDQPDSGLFEPFHRAGLARVPCPGGTAHGFTGAHDGPTIDHIVVSSHFEFDHAEVVHDRPEGRLPSDHWPVRTTLTLKQSDG